MKRIITFMMALALVLSLGIAAFAAGDGSIKITNATVGVNYKLYKIFDATYDADAPDTDGDGTKDVVAYSLKTDSPVYTYMFDGKATVDGKIVGDYFTYEVATGVITMNPEIDDEEDNKLVFEYLTAMVRSLYSVEEAPAGDKCFVANQTATSQVVEFTGLDYGYYLIDPAEVGDTEAEKAKIAVTITTNTPSIEVIEKNQLPGGDFGKDISSDGITWETDDKNSLSVGDTAYFKLSFIATNYDGDEKVTYYKITDTMNPAGWATIDYTSLVVKVAGTEITNYTLTEKADGFEINIPWVDAAGNFLYTAVTSEVVVTYNAVVTDVAAGNDGAQTNENSAQLDWDYDSEPDVPGDKTETDVYSLGFTKVDGATNDALTGAKFELYSNPECTTPVKVKLVSNGLYMVDPTGTNKIETSENGKVVIQGLAEGTYYLKETEAPAGYNKLAAPVAMTVGAAKTGELTVNSTEYELFNNVLTIENNSGVELPSTGGKGTMMLITFGSVVAMAFAMLLITQKKMSIYRD